MRLKISNDEQIYKWIRQGKKFVCFGKGNFLESLCGRTGLEKYIEWITDDNPSLWGRNCKIKDRYIPIIAPEKRCPCLEK